MSGRVATGGGGPARRRAGALRLRTGSVGDAPTVARVMRAAIRGLGAAPYTGAELRAWSSLPALYHRWAMTVGGERYVVAERDGVVVGYAARRGSELTAVFVLPRAASGGVGSALVRHAERAARRAGAPLPGGTALAAVRMEKRLDRVAPARRTRPRRTAASAGRTRRRPS